VARRRVSRGAGGDEPPWPGGASRGERAAMSPTPLAAALLAAIAVSTALIGELAALAAVALVAGVVVDARAVRRAPTVVRDVPHTLSRGVPAALTVAIRAPAGSVRVRQAAPPDVDIAPREGDGGLDATLVARRRGRHTLPALGTRTAGPLRLASWNHRVGEAAELSVYPDLAASRRLALSVRRGQFREQGVSARGPLGLGTDFELVRDYLPDDDIRQVNWRATARLGRPMSNQYRVEQDRDVVLLVDAGRLAAAALPESSGTVLDATLDALAAVALVADAVGDRCGTIAFDRELHVELRPRRAGGSVVVRALHDLEPRLVDSDYEAAFRRVEGSKRAFVLILTDLLEPVAVRSLADAVPVLARRHAVVVASPADPGLRALATAPPERDEDVARVVAAAVVEDAREAAAARVRAAGAGVVDAPPAGLARACVAAYLRAKSRALV
jgi:uncharacterized protein (DUF58 family)